ncbi:hypothetical protein [Actinoplanes sp. NPDC026670]|uniref:hypothetical protein n=1 Tax=Actinoplanes sp. NPDC026670 TaxID=3154700 RepID=UPI0034085838
MTPDEDFRAQLAVERRYPGWQIDRATQPRTVRPDLRVPAGHYWAVHWELDEPCLVAADLDGLMHQLTRRDTARIATVREVAEARWPGWRVGYSGAGATGVAGIEVPPGYFYAVRRGLRRWRTRPVIGANLTQICDRIRESIRPTPKTRAD